MGGQNGGICPKTSQGLVALRANRSTFFSLLQRMCMHNKEERSFRETVATSPLDVGFMTTKGSIAGVV